ncbi:MAG TPA: Ppx/GppA phosphatase family protein [Solirubrobacteraceae bacterium]|nr:Ppx/GppA phosphatase family protein [Solirubrobacteraceae bacterium]
MRAGERLAVIDLGSNSFRLVVFAAGDGFWRRTDEIYEPVRIGEGMGESGELGSEPTRRALATLDVFAHFCRAAGLSGAQVETVATSAIREAVNRDEFLAQAGRHFAEPIRVLSAHDEARYGYIAAANSTTIQDGLVLELGGGSMQVVHVAGREERETASWPLGTVRMTERFVPPNGAAKPRQLKALGEHVASELARAEWLDAAGGDGAVMVGVGGTVRNLAAAVQRAAGLPSGVVQGVEISRPCLEELIARLAALPAEERASIPGIKPARADLILAGALVVLGVMRHGGFDTLQATEAGLREGIFLERLLAPSDPPLVEDVRRAGVMNLANQYDLRSEHTEHVAALALEMFDQLAALGLHAGDPGERELLWAACMLHDIGMSIDYDDHHKHSRYLILNGGLPGFTPQETAIVAQAARYHRKGLPSPGPLGALFDGARLAELDRCALLLRLAEDLERSRDQLVRAVELADDGETVDLRLVASGETAVPRWAASREGGLFRRAFGRELAVAG